MNCTNKQQETAECEKRGCKGCFYNDEIQVGEWIRTHDGEIDRVIDIRDTLGERKLVGFERHIPLKSDIGLKHITKKHSFNIIDLIEVRRLCKWRKSKQC